LVRSVWEDQRRFPLQIATVLSQQFAGHGLQFFKVNKTITHVSVARPHYLDLAAAPVSEGVKKIVEFINAHPRCTRKVLVEALAPTPAAPTVIPIAPAPPPPEGQAPAEPPQAAAAPDPNQPTPEQTLVISDLHWLIHQGHVIEFANGTLETAKKPLPKPPKPEKPKAPETAAAAAAVASGTPADAAVAIQTPATQGEITASPSAEAATPSVETASSVEVPPAPAEQGGLGVEAVVASPPEAVPEEAGATASEPVAVEAPAAPNAEVVATQPSEPQPAAAEADKPPQPAP
jgi:hypothetical protein